jgi:hypothetical protein
MVRKPIGLSIPYRKVKPMHTQDEIIEMARDSGMDLYGLGKDRYRFVHHLEAFAKLVIERHHAKTKQVQTKKESA